MFDSPWWVRPGKANPTRVLQGGGGEPMTMKNQPGQEIEHSELLKELDEISSMGRFPTGMGRIARGKCPVGACLPIACMFCQYGHMLECHHTQTCEEAQCSHYLVEMAVEGGLDEEV